MTEGMDIAALDVEQTRQATPNTFTGFLENQFDGRYDIAAAEQRLTNEAVEDLAGTLYRAGETIQFTGGNGLLNRANTIPPPYPPATPVYTGPEHASSPGGCSTNRHYFDCRHETRCYCGQTERLPVGVSEGL